MKKFLAPTSLLLVAFSIAGIAMAATFTDISDHKYETAIEYIADLEIVEGYSDGTYDPDSKINRAELMKIILEANDVDTSDELSDCFPDVEDDWYAKYVCEGKELGIVGGYPDGTFLPGNNVNFVEALKIIELGYGAEIEEGTPWYEGYVDEAEEKELIPYDIYSYETEITRGQMADIITRQLTYEDGTQEEYIDGLPTINRVVDTNQTTCYNDHGSEITCSDEGDDFYGQDANYEGNKPTYNDNGDGTVTDNITGLMWQQEPGDKMDYYDAVDAADDFSLAGYDDWRVPTTKELYSLIDFNGEDVDPMASEGGTPFINDDVFGFEYGDTSAGDRIIDSQWVASNIYESDVMNGQECFFGLNFADGRIKCYPTSSNTNNGYFAIYVRGDSYGLNDFVDNGDETITDNSTDLIWQKGDSDEGLDWEDALSYCEDLEFADNSDWRLPNVKELQYIIDYTRSPDTTDSAALDSIFEISEITNELGEEDYPYFWSGTTHVGQSGGNSASFVSFGRGMGYFDGEWMDVHGAGSQKSDPKSGDPDDYSEGRGPQGDAVRIYNYARCVRG
jgi:hypothetical protein